MPIISRDDAAARLWRFYYTGLRCRHGHLAPRRVDNGSCVQCLRERALRAKREKAKNDPPPDLSELW